jgi:hypothetical protein
MDFTPYALQDLYVYESTGRGHVCACNGYAHGKKMMDVNLAQWREDMWKTLWPWELYEDPHLPDWWLDKVLGFEGSRLYGVDSLDRHPILGTAQVPSIGETE